MTEPRLEAYLASLPRAMRDSARVTYLIHLVTAREMEIEHRDKHGPIVTIQEVWQRNSLHDAVLGRTEGMALA